MRKIMYRAKIQGHKGYVVGTPINLYSDSEHNHEFFDAMQYMDKKGIPRSEYIEIDTLHQGIEHNGKIFWEGDYDKDGDVIVWCDKCFGWQFSNIDTDCCNCNGEYSFIQMIAFFEPKGNIFDKKLF